MGGQSRQIIYREEIIVSDHVMITCGCKAIKNTHTKHTREKYITRPVIKNCVLGVKKGETEIEWCRNR